MPEIRPAPFRIATPLLHFGEGGAYLGRPRYRRAHAAADGHGGAWAAGAGVIPPGITGYDSTRAPFPHDPDSARALLAEAGYADGLTLKLWRTQRSEFARIAQAIQQDLAAVGIQVEIVERDASSARAARPKGEADLFLTDWYADYPDPESFNYPAASTRRTPAAAATTPS